MGFLELMLHEEQPAANPTGDEINRQEHQKGKRQTNQENHRAIDQEQYRIMAKNAAQAVAQRHVGSDGKTLQHQEKDWRSQNEYDQRIAIEPVAQPLPPIKSAVFPDGHGFDIAKSPLVEITGKLMVQRVRPPPMIIGSKGQDTNQPPEHLIGGS